MSVNLILTVAVIGMVGFNTIATVVKNSLDKLAAGSEADRIAARVASISSTVLGFLTANTQLLPASVQQELPQPAAATPAGAPAQNPGK